jgi:hypothetical protein
MGVAATLTWSVEIRAIIDIHILTHIIGGRRRNRRWFELGGSPFSRQPFA